MSPTKAKSRQKPTVQAHSAGGLVVTKRDSVYQVLLTQNSWNDLWVIPKGHLDPGETPEAAAVREIQEETGLDTEVICHLGHVFLWTSLKRVKIKKRVDVYLMEVVGSDELDPAKFDPEEGLVGDAQWYDFATAKKLISYSNMRHMFDEAKEYLEKHGS